MAATVISVETVRASCLRITWQWVDVDGVVYGPQVSHVPLGTDAQAYADTQEISAMAALAAAEINANLEEIVA